VQLILRAMACLVLVFWFSHGYGMPAAARPGQELMPDQSATKAKAVVRQVIATLGGSAYLNVHDSDARGASRNSARVATSWGSHRIAIFGCCRQRPRRVHLQRPAHCSGFLLGVDDLSISHGGVLITVFDGDRAGYLISLA